MALKKIVSSSYIQFCLLFILVLSVYINALNANIEEDSIYLALAESIIDDQDYNILNQVNRNFGWLVTENLKHPSQHSVIQTPSFVLVGYIENLIGKIFGKITVNQYVLTGIFLNIFSLFIGFIYCKKTLSLFALDITVKQFLFLITSTVLFYFSYFTISVLEIFCFPLSAYVLYSLFLFDKKRENEVNLIALTLSISLLLSSKITHLPLFLGTSFLILKSAKSLGIRKIFYSFLAASLIFVPSALNMFSQYGEFLFQNTSYIKIICDYSFFNIYETITQGYFGIGGFFYSSPIFLPIFIALSITFFRKVLIDKTNLIFYSFLYMWLGMSFFQTMIFVGPAVEDQYVGRSSLNSLPLIILGFSIIVQFLKNKSVFKYILAAILIPWQFFTLFNFVNLYNKGHYEYAKVKIVNSTSDFFGTIQYKLEECVLLFSQNSLQVLAFTLITTSLLIVLIKNTKSIDKFQVVNITFISAFLFIFSLLNYFNSEANNKIFFGKDENKMERVIANDSNHYFFVYAIDMLEAQLKNTKNPRMINLINNTRINYYNSLKGKATKSTPAFKKALDNYDYTFGYFYKNFSKESKSNDIQ